jgi:hypothetical protein
MGAFRGAQEPVEGSDGEVNDVPVGLAVNGMLGVEHVTHVTDDWDVGRAGALCWVISVVHGFEERSEWGMVPDGSRSFLSGIWATQVGDPLPHCQ